MMKQQTAKKILSFIEWWKTGEEGVTNGGLILVALAVQAVVTIFALAVSDSWLYFVVISLVPATVVGISYVCACVDLWLGDTSKRVMGAIKVAASKETAKEGALSEPECRGGELSELQISPKVTNEDKR